MAITIADDLQKELGLYSKDIIDEIKTITTDSMKKLVKESKDKAPKGHRKKHYKSNITSTTTSNTDTAIEQTWYVKSPDYRLTHLLVNGHAKRSGGRVAAQDFLSPIVDDVQKEYQEKIEEVLKK